MADTAHLARRLAELQRELDQLRSELHGQNAVPAPDSPGTEPPGRISPVARPWRAVAADADPRGVEASRRSVLRRGALALGAGIAGAGRAGRSAAAADGDPVKVGQPHVGTKTTRITTSGVNADGLWGDSTATSGKSWGLRGSSASPDGSGVTGQNLAASGLAAGVTGEANSTEGVGVLGTARNPNPSSVSFGTGVKGVTHSPDGVGVLGEHVVKDGVGLGVQGLADTRFGAGVRGQNFGRGAGVEGVASVGIGGVFSGGQAGVLLGSSGVNPNDDVILPHLAGEVYRDDADDLWFCTKSGSPGTWFKLTSPGVVPVTPFRVYDSRFADGPLPRAANRVVNVRDAIDVVTGAVVKQNAVPTNATAVLFNLAITNTVGAGFVAAAPGTATKISSASINWSTTGQTLNNGTFVQLDGNRQMRAFVDGTAGARTDFIVDVTGVVLS